MADEIPPLSPQEKAHYTAEASAGRTPSLEIIRRFIATIRKSFTANPNLGEKSQKPRTAKAKPDDKQIDFF